MPSDLVTRFMSKFIDVEFELREASTQRRWQVQIGPRRNKAKYEYLLLVRSLSSCKQIFFEANWSWWESYLSKTVAK